jgi:uracil-DNA glycosylase family 4
MRTENIKKDGKIWLAGWGNDEAPIMIIASHPRREDLHEGMILATDEDNVYTSRTEIDAAFEAVGLDLENDCWVTSVVKYGLGSKDKPSADQIEECAAELDEEIAHVKPKLIITLGAEVFKRVMKQNIAQSDYIGEIIDSPYGKVLANYSPSQVFSVDPKLRPEFIANFELARRFINDELKYTDFEYLVIRDPRENAQLIKQCIKDEMFSVGYDMEWKGKFMQKETLYSFQYSVTPDQAIVLPLLSDFDKENENTALLNTMKPLLEHPKTDRLGWNIRADDKRLVIRGFKIPDETLGFDGMKAMAFFDSRWGKGLEFGIKKFTNYKPYYNKLNTALRKYKLAKEEMSDVLFEDSETFYEYAAGDAVSHREACINMRNKMKKDLPFYVRKYYFDTYLPLTHYLMDMEVTGIPIDIDCMLKLTEQYGECYGKLEKRLLEMTSEMGFNTTQYEALEATLGADAMKTSGVYKDFNPRSALAKKALFFDKLGLTPAYYVRKGKTKPKAWYDKQKEATKKQYNPSANGKSMASIRFELADKLKDNPDDEELLKKYNLVKTYLDMARVSVFSSKFFSTQGVNLPILKDLKAQPVSAVEGEEEEIAVDDEGDTLKSSYWAGLGTDMKIHPDFYECLDNFRSSSRPNVQNPASKVLSHIPTIFNEFGLETPKNIRNIFYSGDKDWHFAEVDVAGADLAIAAFLSQDKAYIKDILNGGFHTTKMREYFKDPNLSKNEASKYVTAKSITFRVAYTAGLLSAALPIQAEIFAESGQLVDIKLIEYALNTWLRYDTYMAYRQNCQDQVEHSNCISNMRGMKYYFEKTENFSIKAGWMNQSLAYPIASELALFMYDVIVSMKKRFVKDKVWMKLIKPINCVHDASQWVVHKDLLKDNYFPEVCKQYFTKEISIATGDNLGIEMYVGDRWKGKEVILAKETKWSFERKCWEWES